MGFEIVLFHPIAAAPLDGVRDSSLATEVMNSNTTRSILSLWVFAAQTKADPVYASNSVLKFFQSKRNR
jgi:hypothetical protein